MATPSTLPEPEPDPAPPGLDPEDEQIVIPDDPSIENGEETDVHVLGAIGAKLGSDFVQGFKDAIDREERRRAAAATVDQQQAPAITCTATLAPGGWRVEYRAPELELSLDVPSWNGVERVLVEVLKRS